MTRYLYLYENIFPDCVAFKFIESLILIVHNDTDDMMRVCMPKLEKQLGLHEAVCGVSLPSTAFYRSIPSIRTPTRPSSSGTRTNGSGILQIS